jgi:hypothetical protein
MAPRCPNSTLRRLKFAPRWPNIAQAGPTWSQYGPTMTAYDASRYNSRWPQSIIAMSVVVAIAATITTVKKVVAAPAVATAAAAIAAISNSSRSNKSSSCRSCSSNNSNSSNGYGTNCRSGSRSCITCNTSTTIIITTSMQTPPKVFPRFSALPILRR